MSSRRLNAGDLKGAHAVKWARGRIAYLKSRASSQGMTPQLKAGITQAHELLRKGAR